MRNWDIYFKQENRDLQYKCTLQARTQLQAFRLALEMYPGTSHHLLTAIPGD
jgi:hypothetical protein